MVKSWDTASRRCVRGRLGCLRGVRRRRSRPQVCGRLERRTRCSELRARGTRPCAVNRRAWMRCVGRAERSELKCSTKARSHRPLVALVARCQLAERWRRGPLNPFVRPYSFAPPRQRRRSTAAIQRGRRHRLARARALRQGRPMVRWDPGMCVWAVARTVCVCTSGWNWRGVSGAIAREFLRRRR